MSDETKTQRVGVAASARDKITNARREASRVALVLETPYAAAGCDNLRTSGAAVIYERDGRVYHLVVYDMGKVG